MKRRFDVYELLAKVRLRPAMYIGTHSLVRLRAFVDGCFFMAREHELETSEQPKFDDFHDWTAKRFGWSESTAGWCEIIVQECGGDEGSALDRFFELIDEYCHPLEPAVEGENGESD